MLLTGRHDHHWAGTGRAGWDNSVHGHGSEFRRTASSWAACGGRCWSGRPGSAPGIGLRCAWGVRAFGRHSGPESKRGASDGRWRALLAYVWRVKLLVERYLATQSHRLVSYGRQAGRPVRPSILGQRILGVYGNRPQAARGYPSVLLRQRIDFLLLFPRHVRVVLEVDGKQHYVANDQAKPELSGQMMAKDRRLRLRGYAVYRFGGYELMNATTGAALLRQFFDELEQRYGD